MTANKERKAIIKEEKNGVYIKSFTGKEFHLVLLGIKKDSTRTYEEEANRMFEMVVEFLDKGLKLAISMIAEQMKEFEIKLLIHSQGKIIKNY